MTPDNPFNTDSRKGLHILVLDNETEHVELIRRAFEEIRDTCRVTFIGTLEAARSEIARDPPDLIIADWLLPDGKGIDILPRKDGHITTPLIIMTSHGNEKLAVEMMKSGAIDYIIKSDVTFIDLPHIVERTLREWEHINMRIRMDEELQRNYQELKVLNADIAAREEELRKQYNQLKEQELNLKASEERERLLLQYSGLGIGYWDYDGRLLFFNQKAAENIGGSPEEFIGKRMNEIFPPDIAEYYLERIRSMLFEETNHEFEDFISSPGGDRWYLSTMSNVRDTTGKKIGVQVISQEITDRKRAEEALHDSEELFRLVIDTLPIGLWLADRNGTLLSGNPAGQQIWAANPHVGREEYGVFKAWHLPAREPVQPDDWALSHAVNEGITTSFELLEIEAFDGTHKVILNWAAPVKNASGEIIGAFVINQDVTDTRKAEEALRESEAFLSSIVDNIPTMVFVKDAATLQYVKINKGAEELLGYSREEMIGKDDLHFFPEEEAAHFQSFDRKVLESNTLIDIPEEKVATRKGERIVHTRKIPIADTDGKSRYLIGISEDITETIEAREKIAENEEKFRMIFDNANDSVYMIEVTPAGMPGRFLDVNAVICSSLGYSREELLQKNILDINTPETKNKAVANMTELFLHGFLTFESGHLRKDGSVVPVEVSTHLYQMKGKNVIIAVARDISQRKKEEKALRLANQKLQLMNIVAWHDIQNKITGLRGYVELSKNLINNEKAREFIAREEEILRIIHEHLQHTKEYQEMGKEPLQWVNIPNVLRRVLSMVDKGEVSISSDVGDLELFCDPVIEKVFSHLIDHSLSRSSRVSRIQITCRESPAGLVLIYEDNGTGIPAEEKASIFVRDVAKTSGFGLYFIHDILELSEMDISETGEPGIGTRFEITVPHGAYRFTGK